MQQLEHPNTSAERTSAALSSIDRDRERQLERRASPRRTPPLKKTVLVFAKTVAEVRDESEGGVCLKLPAAASFAIGDAVAIRDEVFNRVGRVCWTSLSGTHRLVGFSWVDSETPTKHSLDLTLRENDSK